MMPWPTLCSLMFPPSGQFSNAVNRCGTAPSRSDQARPLRWCLSRETRPPSCPASLAGIVPKIPLVGSRYVSTMDAIRRLPAQSVTICQDIPENGLPADIDWAWYLEQPAQDQAVPGYRHRSQQRLLGHGPAVESFEPACSLSPKEPRSSPRERRQASHTALELAQLSHCRVLQDRP